MAPWPSTRKQKVIVSTLRVCDYTSGLIAVSGDLLWTELCVPGLRPCEHLSSHVPRHVQLPQPREEGAKCEQPQPHRWQVVSDMGLRADASPFHKVPTSMRVLLPMAELPAPSLPLPSLRAARVSLLGWRGPQAARMSGWTKLHQPNGQDILDARASPCPSPSGSSSCHRLGPEFQWVLGTPEGHSAGLQPPGARGRYWRGHPGRSWVGGGRGPSGGSASCPCPLLLWGSCGSAAPASRFTCSSRPPRSSPR